MLRLADISFYQGTPDFNQLKSQLDGIIIKATEGTGYTDPQFENNQGAAWNAGIPRMFYHLARPDLGNSPEDEAAWFWQVISPIISEGCVLGYDAEPNFGITDDIAARFINKLKELSGTTALIYLNKSQETGLSWTQTVTTGAGLWLADYEDTGTANPWPFIAIRQTTSKGTLSGINGSVDLDVFYGDIVMFEKYGYQKPAPQPTPAPVPTFTQADIDAAFQKGAASRQSEIDSLNQQLQEVQVTVSNDKLTLQQDDTIISQDKVTEANLVQKVQALTDQVTQLTSDLRTKGQIVTPLGESESVLQRVIDFFESLMAKGVK